MEKKQILRVSFLIWFICLIAGAVLKIMHHPYGEILLPIAVISYIIFACLVIYKVVKSRNIERIEKSMWIIGMIFFGTIAGTLYFLIGRKRIVNEEEISSI